MAFSTAKPLSSQTALGQISPSQEQYEAVTGELWTVKRDGEDWPVVICDEEIVDTFFKGKVRPFNARRADGTWREEFKPGGPNIDQRCYPAIVLGRFKFTWAPWKSLEPFDKDMGQVIQVSTPNSSLAEGWQEALRLDSIEDPLSVLKAKIRQQRLERGGSKVPTDIAGVERIKRKGTPKFKYPPGYRKEEVDDEESEELLVQPKIKQELSDSSSLTGIDRVDGSNDLVSSESEQPRKKSKLDGIGRFSMRPSTPVRGATQRLSSTRRSMNRATPIPGPLKNLPPDPSRVMIYVGNPHTKFGVRRCGLDASPLLSHMVSHRPENGYYAMSPVLSRLDKDDFLPVAQYLERGEYDPNILDEGTEWVRLEVNLTGREAGEEVVRCAVIYDMARTLELPGLQDLAFRKLKALAKNVPHQPYAILDVVDLVFKEAREDMRRYLVEYLAEHFWTMVEEENSKLSEAMKGDEELARGVFGLLAGAPASKGKTEDGDLFGNVKIEPTSPTIIKEDKEEDLGVKEAAERDATDIKITKDSSTKKHTLTPDLPIIEEFLAENDAILEKVRKQGAAADPPDANELDGEKEEGIGREEQEMIKMALRKCDYRATVEDDENSAGADK